MVPTLSNRSKVTYQKEVSQIKLRIRTMKEEISVKFMEYFKGIVQLSHPDAPREMMGFLAQIGSLYNE